MIKQYRYHRTGRTLRILLSILVVLMTFPFISRQSHSVSAADDGSWSHAGVAGSEVIALAVAPSNTNIIYAGTGSYIYKSSNGGTTWPENHFGFAAFAFAIHPANSDIVYAGQFGYEVLKTINGGVSWIKLPSIGASTHRAIAIDPLHADTVYVGIQDGWGAYKSSNGGASWAGVLASTNTTSFAINPNDTQTIYMGAVDYVSSGNLISAGGVFRSPDGGQNWVRVTTTQVNALAINPLDGRVVYAATDAEGVQKSIDGGGSWAPANAGLTAPSVRALAIDPQNPQVVYAGTWEGGVFRSTNGGASWSSINTGLTNTYILSLAIDPARPHILYAGTKGGGVFKWFGKAPPDPQSTYAHLTDTQGNPISGAQIYRNGVLVQDAVSSATTTDISGNLVLPTAQPGDTLVALVQQDERTSARRTPGGWAYRVYTTSMRVQSDGSTQAFTIAAVPGPQTLSVSASPLVLFNLVVSIEWDATDDYLATIKRAMKLASDYLFDVTDGQMAFGQVAIYERGEHWTDADIQIATNNIVRPHSYIGGLTAADPSHVIRVGRGWDGASGNQGAWDRQEGYRTLTHEFAHYALYLYDSYFGFERDQSGNITTEVPASCTGPENHNRSNDTTNATIMDYQYASSELSMRNVAGLWSGTCLVTAQWQINGESDWETLLRKYADTSTPVRWRLTSPADRGGVLAGPTELPVVQLNFPIVTLHPRGAGDPPILLTVLRPDGSPQREAIVALYHADGMVIGQGLTDTQGQLLLYGASAGDVVRAASFDSGLAGSATVGQVYPLVITLRPLGTAQLQAGGAIPHLRVIAEPGIGNQTSLLIRLEGFASDADPSVLVTAPGSTAGFAPTLGYSAGGYGGTVSFSATIHGTGRIQASGGSGGGLVRLQSTYRLQQVLAGQRADVFSDDGNLNLHLDDGSLPGNSAYLVVMPPGSLPGALPDGLALVGNAYDVTASGGIAELVKPASLRLSYDRALVSAAAPEQMSIHRWNPNSQHWEKLASTLDTAHHTMEAPTLALGTFALLAPQGDWELPGPRRAYLPVTLR